jgi:hypothetical protein
MELSGKNIDRQCNIVAGVDFVVVLEFRVVQNIQSAGSPVHGPGT